MPSRDLLGTRIPQERNGTLGGGRRRNRQMRSRRDGRDTAGRPQRRSPMSRPSVLRWRRFLHLPSPSRLTEPWTVKSRYPTRHPRRAVASTNRDTRVPCRVKGSTTHCPGSPESGDAAPGSAHSISPADTMLSASTECRSMRAFEGTNTSTPGITGWHRRPDSARMSAPSAARSGAEGRIETKRPGRAGFRASVGTTRGAAGGSAPTCHACRP